MVNMYVAKLTPQPTNGVFGFGFFSPTSLSISCPPPAARVRQQTDRRTHTHFQLIKSIYDTLHTYMHIYIHKKCLKYKSPQGSWEVPSADDRKTSSKNHVCVCVRACLWTWYLS